MAKFLSYRVSDGVCVVSMSLVKHIPSHVAVAGYRTLIYEGRPTTCYSCNDPGLLQTACPNRWRERVESRPATTASLAEMAAKGPISNTTTIVDRATDIAAPKKYGGRDTAGP